MALENILNGAKNTALKAGRRVLPYIASLSMAAYGLGCAGTFPSPEKVREMKPKPTSETVQYKSKFEESVIRDSPKGFERDKYAALWTLFNYRYPEYLREDLFGNKKKKGSLDTLSVVENKSTVDSIINIYTSSLDQQPDEPGNSFLVRDLSEIVKWLNDGGLTYPNELHLSEYFDDVGKHVVGKGIPQGVGMSKFEKARTNSAIQYNGPGLETWRLTWDEEDGEYIFQDDGHGRWTLVSNSIAEESSSGEKDEYSKFRRAIGITTSIVHKEFQGPISVKDEDKKLDANSADVNVASYLDTTNWSSYLTAINFGPRIIDFLDDSTLFFKGKYRISVLGSDQMVLSGEFSRVGTFPNYKDIGKGDVGAFQFSTPRIPQEFIKRDRNSYVFGLDVENSDGEHYKTLEELFIDNPNVGSHGYGWIVQRENNSGYIGGRPPAFKSYNSPGDTLDLLLQIPNLEPDENGNYRANMQFYTILKDDFKEGRVEVGPLWTMPGVPPDAYRQPQKRRFAVRDINLGSSRGFASVPVVIPKLDNGIYQIVAEVYSTQKEKGIHTVILDNIKVRK